MRVNLEDALQEKSDLTQVRVGAQRLAMGGNLTLGADTPVAFFLDPNGSNRTVTLPAICRGKLLMFFHIGSANSIVIKTPAGATLVTLTTLDAVQCVSSALEWRYLTKTSDIFLDPTEITAADGTITVTVVGGTSLTIGANASAIDHNALLNYVANKHIDHTAISIATAATSGLSGGGDIGSTRNLIVDLTLLAAGTPVLGDSFAFNHAVGAANKATLTVLNGILDHNGLLNFVANKHIDHTAVTIGAGTGISGGGDISASRTINLDINGLTTDSPASGDFLPFYDISGSDLNKATIANIISAGGGMIGSNNLSEITVAATARTNLGLGTIATFAETTAAQFQANTAGKALSTDKVWSAAAPVTLTDASTVTPDFSAGFDFIWTIGATGRTLANPTSPKAGQKGVLYIVQDGTGSRTITTWGSQYKFAGGTKPTLSTAAGSIDVISYCCKSTTEVECFFVGGMS